MATFLMRRVRRSVSSPAPVYEHELLQVARSGVCTQRLHNHADEERRRAPGPALSIAGHELTILQLWPRKFSLTLD